MNLHNQLCIAYGIIRICVFTQDVPYRTSQGKQIDRTMISKSLKKLSGEIDGSGPGPWIKPENASIDALKAQIEQCPSGALTYKMAGDSDSASDVVSEATTVELIKNGPMSSHIIMVSAAITQDLCIVIVFLLDHGFA